MFMVAEHLWMDGSFCPFAFSIRRPILPVLLVPSLGCPHLRLHSHSPCSDPAISRPRLLGGPYWTPGLQSLPSWPASTELPECSPQSPNIITLKYTREFPEVIPTPWHSTRGGAEVSPSSFLPSTPTPILGFLKSPCCSLPPYLACPGLRLLSRPLLCPFCSSSH